MVNIKKRIYVFGTVVMALILLGGAMFVWNLIGSNGKQQDKVYSGAKLVYHRPLNIIEGNSLHGYNG